MSVDKRISEPMDLMEDRLVFTSIYTDTEVAEVFDVHVYVEHISMA